MYLNNLDPLYPFKPLLEAIENRPDRVDYLEDVKEWLRYLQGVEHRTIRITMTKGKGEDLEPVLLSFEYPHRWRDTYRNMTLAKLYKLEDALKGQDQAYTLMSLTTYQDGEYSRKKIPGGYSIPESFEVLSDRGRALMHQVKRRMAPDLQYLWTVEPHKLKDSGYPHRHYIMNRVFTEEETARIRHLWSDLYRAGSRDHGIDFSVRTTEGSLRSLRNYVMAYLAKSLSPHQLTPGEVVYHAVAARHHYRFWGASREWSALMQRAAAPSPLQWVMTQVVDEWGDAYTAHQADQVAGEVLAIIQDWEAGGGAGIPSAPGAGQGDPLVVAET
jgi:hypothetical protein